MSRRRLWFTSDLHIGHKNIITYCDRPWKTEDSQPDVRAMNRALVSNWNERVAKDDLVIVVGDFAWGPMAYQKNWPPMLNGHKTLVLGNHDRLTKTCYERMGFEVHKKLRWGRIHIQHYPPLPARAEELKADGVEVVLCGHVHERWVERETAGLRVINVGVDVRGFRPVSPDELGLDASLLTMRAT